MSFLAPLYVLGALGIGFPIVFHLIRRQPRGQQRFSSLMFLKPTPPTLTRRSRLDHWPLLLLRALALILLAAAFARPFLRSPLAEADSVPGKRIVMLIDTSASMRRDGLWQQVNQVASESLKQLKPTDQIAVIAFDSKPRVELSLEQSAALDFDLRREAASQAIQGIKPTWSASELGAALVFAADLLSVTEADETQGPGPDAKPSTPAADQGHVLVISDMQNGGEQNLKRLQAYSWPKQVKVEIHQVSTDRHTNAVASVLPPGLEEEDTAQLSSGERSQGKTRVRVTNSVDASAANFSLAWADDAGTPIAGTQVSIHVGPGESHVVRMSDPTASSQESSSSRLVLQGDDHEFDNVRFIARQNAVERQVLFIGPDTADARDSLFYYLQRAPLDSVRQKVTVTSHPVSGMPEPLDPQKTPLIIIANPLADPQLERLKRYVSSGGRLLWVLDAAADLAFAQRSLSRWMDATSLSITEGVSRDYAMLSSIDFSHPLFSPFADTRYNDFSKIRFWSHRALDGLPDSVQTVASFDDGHPALVQQSMGRGQWWILTSGWQPTNSQLALSTKFVPLLAGIFRFGDTDSSAVDQVAMDDVLPFAPSPTATIGRVGEAPIAYRSRSDASAVLRPGVYRFVDGENSRLFAVNIAESESRTQPMANDELERYGVVLGGLTDGSDLVARQRQRRDVELESRQRLWQWILLGVLGLLAIESWLGGYLDRRQAQPRG
ncbi:MAG: BatA domain-containing protein [Planctomycetaceae bacterium]